MAVGISWNFGAICRFNSQAICFLKSISNSIAVFPLLAVILAD